MSRRGVLTINSDLLAAALGLPTGSRIVAFGETEAWRGTIQLLVEHSDLPDTADGEPYPEVDVVTNRTVEWRVAGLVPPEEEDVPRWPEGDR